MNILCFMVRHIVHIELKCDLSIAQEKLVTAFNVFWYNCNKSADGK